MVSLRRNTKALLELGASERAERVAKDNRLQGVAAPRHLDNGLA